MTQTETISNPYSSIADIYDEVMHDVDYETWADYIDEIIIQHHPGALDILELACGTGTMALSLEELDCYKITATDGSADMIRVAKQKAKRAHSEIEFFTMDFLDIRMKKDFDVVFMVFDSINYLHNDEEIIKLHSEVGKILKPGGIFIFDFTTPRNSRKAILHLNNDTKTVEGKFHYNRESTYDGRNQIHTNHFRIHYMNPVNGSIQSAHEEIHRQKIYTKEKMEAIIKRTDFTILKAYDGFELKPAHEKSLRITMVLQ